MTSIVSRGHTVLLSWQLTMETTLNLLNAYACHSWSSSSFWLWILHVLEDFQPILFMLFASKTESWSIWNQNTTLVYEMAGCSNLNEVWPVEGKDCFKLRCMYNILFMLSKAGTVRGQNGKIIVFLKTTEVGNCGLKHL